MARSRQTVAKLALEAGFDADEALLVLWDAGFRELSDPSDALARHHANRARRALGIATRRDFRSAQYWQRLFGVDEEGLTSILSKLNIFPSPQMTRLPKGSVTKLKAEARRLGILTGISDQETSSVAQQPVPPFLWRTVGRNRGSPIRLLTFEEVVQIHEALVLDFSTEPDPISPAGVRDENMLRSGLFRSSTSLGENLKYPTIEMAGAALLHSLVQNHPFHNGNKRTALVALLVFLDENGLLLTCREKALFFLVLQTAQHSLVEYTNVPDLADREVLNIAEWINGNSRHVAKGDRPVQWRRLRRILTDFGCQCVPRGNKIEIVREVTKPSRWPFRKATTSRFFAQAHYTGDGRDADRKTVNRLRGELYLDEPNGIDRDAFYQQGDYPAGDFIVKYRKTLNRLAKF